VLFTTVKFYYLVPVPAEELVSVLTLKLT
jgi:hypothetical protein